MATEKKKKVTGKPSGSNLRGSDTTAREQIRSIKNSDRNPEMMGGQRTLKNKDKAGGQGTMRNPDMLRNQEAPVNRNTRRTTTDTRSFDDKGRHSAGSNMGGSFHNMAGNVGSRPGDLAGPPIRGAVSGTSGVEGSKQGKSGRTLTNTNISSRSSKAGTTHKKPGGNTGGVRGKG